MLNALVPKPAIVLFTHCSRIGDACVLLRALLRSAFLHSAKGRFVESVLNFAGRGDVLRGHRACALSQKNLGWSQLQRARRMERRSLCETLSIWLSCETPFHITKVIEAFHFSALRDATRARSIGVSIARVEFCACQSRSRSCIDFVERSPCDRRVEHRSTTRV